jgi:hypothetical protein
MATLKSGTTVGGVAAVTISATQTLTNKTSQFVVVDGHASGALSAANVSNTVISNYGQAASNVALTLPAAAAGYSFIAVVGTAQSGNTWKITADTNDKIYLDGTAGTDNQSVIVTPAVGNFITFISFQTGSSAYDWIAVTGNGTWTAGA